MKKFLAFMEDGMGAGGMSAAATTTTGGLASEKTAPVFPKKKKNPILGTIKRGPE